MPPTWLLVYLENSVPQALPFLVLALQASTVLLMLLWER
jgi:hypothetical protein